MMEAVVSGGVENPLEGTKTGDCLSVDPELVQKVELLVGEELSWRDYQRQRKVKNLRIYRQQQFFYFLS